MEDAETGVKRALNLGHDDVNVPGGVGENVGGEVAGENNGGVKLVDGPSVGMVFSSWDEVNHYYRSYGKQQGFGVVCVGGRKPLKTEEAKTVRNYVWKCKCYGLEQYRRVVNGKRVFVNVDPLVKKKSKKCNCLVVLYATMHELGEWVVIKVVNEHQEYTSKPSHSNHIVMFKNEKITKTVEARIDNDYGASSSIPQIYNNLAH
uniref:FAR1 domain-containing protein n=1 Tax=Chenopodium quinoa TaxID=63459 RepID=A0A803LVH5_CHEQI